MFVVILSTCFPLPFVVLRRWMVSMIEPPPPPPQPRAARRIMRIAAKSRGGRGRVAGVSRLCSGQVAGESRVRRGGGSQAAGLGRAADGSRGAARGDDDNKEKNNNDARRETRIRPRRGSVRPLGPSLYHLSNNLSLKISLHISLNPIPSEVGIGKILLKISVII